MPVRSQIVYPARLQIPRPRRGILVAVILAEAVVVAVLAISIGLLLVGFDSSILQEVF